MRQALTLAALIVAVGAARADGVRQPERVTVGAADALLASLAPDDTLYYVSNENATFEIRRQPLGRGGAQLAFDDDGDATWPRVSADGKALLYISYQTDSDGDLCVRELAPGKHGAPASVGARRCLTDDKSAELQAEWIPGERAALVVTRRSLHGAFELWKYFLDGRAPVRLLARSVASPAVSPDGRWLAYVPIEQREASVGVGFSVRTAGVIEIVPLAQPTAPPTRVALGLSGVSATPRFSADGAWLYFGQYLDDTNRDGAIDGNDHGVLCRVPFAGGRVEARKVEQLTTATASCQYPLPAARRLIMTCETRGKLDIFSLPLDGAVPGDWGRARLLEALDASDDAWQRQLLLARLLASERDGARARPLYKQALERDLLAHAFDSAALDLDALERATPATDSDERESIAVWRELVALRRALDRLARGQLSEIFVRETEARRRRIETSAHGATARVVMTLALIEIDDVLGRKRAAADGMEALARGLGGIDDPLVLALVAERGLALWRELDRREALTALLAQLAEHPAQPERRRVQLAQRFVAELLRGRREDARARLLAEASRALPPGGVTATAVELEGLLLQLEGEAPAAPIEGGPLAPRRASPSIHAELMQLAERQPSDERRRLVVETTVERALADNDDDLSYALAARWLASQGRAGALRSRAEALYLDAVLERGYAELRRRQWAAAREHFLAAVRQTDALEAHLGWLEAALAEGRDVVDDYRRRYPPSGDTQDARVGLARAYQLARGLGAERDPATHARRRAEAQAALAPLLEARARDAEVHHLAGFLAHQQFLRTGARDAAEEANGQYLLALDLAATRVRLRTATMSALALLQSQVGNHALALEHWEARAELPFLDARGRATNCLYRARSLLFTDDEERAVKTAERCLRILAEGPELASWRPLAEERAALSYYGARQFAAARDAWARLRALPPPVEPAAAARNPAVFALAQAAAALGAKDAAVADAALRDADRLLGGAPTLPPRQYPFALDRLAAARPSPAALRNDAEILLHGLRAQRELSLRRWPEARAALERRSSALGERLRLRAIDEDLAQLAEDAAQLAATWLRQRQWPQARAALEVGLAHADRYAARTGNTIEEVGLALTTAYAALFASGKLPPAEFLARPRARLEAAWGQLCDKRDPKWTRQRQQVAAYLTWLRLVAR